MNDKSVATRGQKKIWGLDTETDVRTCGRCGTAKPLDLFPRSKNKPLGHGHTCLECNRAAAKSYYSNNATKIIERTTAYRENNREHLNSAAHDLYEENKSAFSIKHKQNYQDNKEAVRARHSKYRAGNKVRVRCWKEYDRALRNGELVRPSTCSVCLRTTKIEGHHTDYTKPLLVVWVCRTCHRALEAVGRK